MSNRGVNGKSIIITGGGSGIGAATVQIAAQLGAKVTIADRDCEAGQAILAKVVADGGEAIFVQVDITDEEQVIGMVEKAVSQYGRLDGAFNNAGVPAYSHQPNTDPVLFAELSLRAFERTLKVNAIGLFFA